MAYILHHSTTFSARGVGYHQMDEGAHSPTGHAHSHGHAHMLGGHGSTSVRAAFVHVVGDLLQSIGVLVAAIIIYFRVGRMFAVCNHTLSFTQRVIRLHAFIYTASNQITLCVNDSV